MIGTVIQLDVELAAGAGPGFVRLPEIGEDMFATMWKLGEAMTVDEAVRYALDET